MKPYDSIKKTLREYEAPIDTEKLWGQTRHAIPQRKRRRGLIIWMLAGLGLLGVAVPYTLQQSYFSEKLNTTSQNAAPVISNSPNNAAIQDSDSSETENVSSDAVINPAGSSSPTPNATDELKAISPFTKKETPPSAKQNGSTHTQQKDHAPQHTQQADSPPGITSILNPVESMDAPTEEMLMQTALPKDHEYDLALSEETTDLIPRNHYPVSQLDALPMAAFDLDKRTDMDPILPERITKRKSNRLHIGLSMMQSVGSSSLSVSSPDPENAAQAAYLQNHIRSLEVLTSTASTNFQLNRGLEIGLAAQRHQLTTSSLFEWTETEVIPGHGITEIIIDEFGNQQQVTGEVDFIRTTDWQSTRFSTHQWYNLSLALSYPVVRGHRISLLGGLHTNYVFAYNAHGAYYDIEKAPFEFNQNNRLFDSPKKWTLGLHSHIRWQLSYEWNARFSLAYQSFQYQLSTQPLKFDHSLWSVGAGIGYQIQ